ncbi:peptidoglycan DD-metalloendopeptidase family protein [Flavobacterium sp. LS1R47]|jgi:murein DD-endopeptidase MepM/ murein hydrolase activator NlpD|uniref:Peptidoglycan DD-metalloendopeptidase family protein n=1 Tax=Flavobacterium frigoritolerans TaxID=2987686 RepID=A0A9X2ZNN7_9FLAO|nr:peptidoglycan DD-metalloendopeptidase family protein [Flavobacterium frigoritolerans]MCV9932775.1 peptidoglycan DD-metalloendopeptidase family protein [Flavobacterium frigoritolerans]
MTTLESVLQNLTPTKVIDTTIDYAQYIPLDLSISNQELANKKPQTATDFENYIENLLAPTKAKVAFGGYLEERNIYKRSENFNNSTTPERNIHIGLDLWIKAGTPVLAVLDGTVHSFKNNTSLGDYGPTIILKHTIENHIFYTLYGHLSLESIVNLKVGAVFQKEQILGTLGKPNVNGDYAPHLHFQIIKNIGDNFGDYPGVCSKIDLDYYTNNCPNPNLVLKIT